VAGLGLALVVTSGCQSQAASSTPASGSELRPLGEFTMTVDPAAGTAAHAVAALGFQQVPVVQDGKLTNPPATLELWSDVGFRYDVPWGTWCTTGVSQTISSQQVFMKNFATETLKEVHVVFEQVSPYHVFCHTLTSCLPAEILAYYGMTCTGTPSSANNSFLNDRFVGDLPGALMDPMAGGTTMYDPWSFEYNTPAAFTIRGAVWGKPTPVPPTSHALLGTTVTWMSSDPLVQDGVLQLCTTPAPCGTDWGKSPAQEYIVTGTSGSYSQVLNTAPLVHGTTYYIFAFNRFLNENATQVRGVYAAGPVAYYYP
jgi:hypothetical protein